MNFLEIIKSVNEYIKLDSIVMTAVGAYTAYFVRNKVSKNNTYNKFILDNIDLHEKALKSLGCFIVNYECEPPFYDFSKIPKKN